MGRNVRRQFRRLGKHDLTLEGVPSLTRDVRDTDGTERITNRVLGIPYRTSLTTSVSDQVTLSPTSDFSGPRDLRPQCDEKTRT